MVVIQSVIRRFPNSLCPTWKHPGRTHGCNEVYCKLGKEITKGHSGARWKLEAEGESLSRCF
jgi:hypothetical protein